jgi:hypothetical protein
VAEAKAAAGDRKEAVAFGADVQSESAEVALAAPRAEAAPGAPDAPAVDGLGKGLIAESEAAQASEPPAGGPKLGGALELSPAAAGASNFGAGRDPALLRSFSSGTFAAEGRSAAAPGLRAEVESEPPIVLDPFIVDAAEDKGSYRANSTLAGTRVRTDLKDVSSAITVMTAQFLQDTGVNSEKGLLAYAPKTEVAGLEDPNAATTTTSTTTTVAPAFSGEETLVLSPFVVGASEDKESSRDADSREGGTPGRPDCRLCAGECDPLGHRPRGDGHGFTRRDRGGRQAGRCRGASRRIRGGERREGPGLDLLAPRERRVLPPGAGGARPRRGAGPGADPP